ncbi:ycxB-like protein [Ditylenchus destructor]|nr:ycxB-like protein [Ditylenchus destructor]
MHKVIVVTYTEEIVRDAVRTYVWRRGVLGNKALWALELAMVVFYVWLLGSGADGSLAGVVGVVVLLPPGLVAVMWLAHYRNTVGKFRRMPSRQGKFTFTEDHLEVASELGSAKIPWSSITEIWQKPNYWMLFMGLNQFMTLPLISVEPTDLAFLQSKVPPAKDENVQSDA